MVYKSIGRVVALEPTFYGFVCRIALYDQAETVLPYACPIRSEVTATRQYGEKRLAQLMECCDIDFFEGSDALLNKDFIVEYDNHAIKKVKPICLVVERWKDRPPLHQRLARLFRLG